MELVRTEPSQTAYKLAREVLTLRTVPLTAEIEAQIIRILQDTIGAMIAGTRSPELRGLVALLPELGPGAATVMGHEVRALSHIAALINGTAGATLEVCEGNQYASNHPADHVLPALLALAEEKGSAGSDFLQAFFVGYEIGVRACRATRVRDEVHPFGTAMIVGTAAACATLQGFDLEDTARAIEVAAGLSIASTQDAANSGASVRNLFTGYTNHNGLLATKYVRAGFHGQPGALETVFGQILGDCFSLDAGEKDDGYYILKNYFKLHACSRWNHAPIEAVIALMMAHDFEPEDIAHIIIYTFDPAIRLNRTVVPNAYAGKHSIPFNVAARILYGSNAASIYCEENVRDPDLNALMAKTELREDPALTALHPAIRAARVEIAFADGRKISAQCDRARGGFDNPLSPDELYGKYMDLATRVYSADAARALYRRIGQVKNLSNMSELFLGE